MRKLRLLAVAALVALMAAPASASVQTIRLSGSLDTTYLYRTNFDLGVSTHGQAEQSFIFSQLLLDVDADLTDNVSVHAGVGNERPWEASTSSTTDIVLYKAFFEIKEALYSPLKVSVGRQPFSYGNSFIVDSAGTNNSASGDSDISGTAADFTKLTSQNAVRLTFDYDPLIVELLFSKIHPNTVSAAVDDRDDKDLYGINITHELGDEMNTGVEGYFFAQYDRSTSSGNNGAGNPADSKVDTVYTPGFLVTTTPLEGLSTSIEYAHQFGTKQILGAGIAEAQHRSAHAVQFIGNYQVPEIGNETVDNMNPVLQYVYTHVSGDSNAEEETGPTKTNTWTAWDPLYENQHGGTIFNTLFDLTNLNIHSLSLTANPMEDVTSTLSWHGLWLDKEIDSEASNVLDSSAANGFTIRNPGGTASDYIVDPTEDFLGYEVDIVTTYDYTEDVQFGLNVGWFIPGDVLVGGSGVTTGVDGAMQTVLNGNVIF